MNMISFNSKHKNYIGYAHRFEGPDSILKYNNQLQTDGRDDTYTWSLDYTIARFLARELEIYRDCTTGCSISSDEEKNADWRWAVNRMILIFSKYGKDHTEVTNEELDEAFHLLRDNFKHLWT